MNGCGFGHGGHLGPWWWGERTWGSNSKLRWSFGEGLQLKRVCVSGSGREIKWSWCMVTVVMGCGGRECGLLRIIYAAIREPPCLR